MKKLMAITLIVVLVLGMCNFCMAQSEPSSWAVGEIDYNAAAFLAAAMNEELDYAKEITREEFAVTALYLYAAVSGMELPEMSIENPFKDCNNPLVVTAYGIGLVKGVSETEFNPTAPVTREQICVMLARIGTALNPELNIDQMAPQLPSLDSFADADKVSDWATDSVKMMVMAGLIKGTDKNELNPLGNCTTQEALVIVKRALNIRF